MNAGAREKKVSVSNASLCQQLRDKQSGDRGHGLLIVNTLCRRVRLRLCTLNSFFRVGAKTSLSLEGNIYLSPLGELL